MTKPDFGAASAPDLAPIDLNDLLLDHPAASFVFQVGDSLAIVDRAALPEDDCMVIVEIGRGKFAVEQYHCQTIFGVITYLIQTTL